MLHSSTSVTYDKNSRRIRVLRHDSGNVCNRVNAEYWSVPHPNWTPFDGEEDSKTKELTKDEKGGDYPTVCTFTIYSVPNSR